MRSVDQAEIAATYGDITIMQRFSGTETVLADDNISVRLAVRSVLTIPHRVTHINFSVEQLKIASVTDAVVQLSQADTSGQK